MPKKIEFPNPLQALQQSTRERLAKLAAGSGIALRQDLKSHRQNPAASNL
jgi:hypothetical protein